MGAPEELLASIRRLDGWLTRHEYRGYEPFDGLRSWLRPLAVTKLARQALVQSGVRLPINLRPLLGIRPHTSTKGIGYCARAYLKLYQATGDEVWLGKARWCLDWLVRHPSPNQPGMSWGNDFDYQTRGYYLAKGGPTVVWTALIGHAFVEAYEITKDLAYLATAEESARFILEGLERRPLGAGLCISYVPTTFLAIHNANMLAAGFLGRVYGHARKDSYLEVAAGAMAYTIGAQRTDGSWWYAEEPKYQWVDNWHTAYVLDSIWWYMRGTGDRAPRESFTRGRSFWLDHFFLPDGTPKFYADRLWLVDIQCASQALESLALYGEADAPACLDIGERVAGWTIAHMQDPDGHFYYRSRLGIWVNRTPMLHWGQTTMLHGLAALLLARRSRAPASGAQATAREEPGA